MLQRKHKEAMNMYLCKLRGMLSGKLIAAMMLVLFLIACTEEKEEEEVRQEAVPIVVPPDTTIAVQALSVIPNSESVTLKWKNPSAIITQISISWTPVESGVLQPIIIDSDTLLASSAEVTQIILGLSNNKTYTFTIIPLLDGADADKNSRVHAETISRLVGPNLDGDEFADNDPAEDYDNDGTLNALDPDDDNDQVNDTMDAFPYDSAEQSDADGDGTGDNADLDDDNDQVNDTMDAFPYDSAEQSDTDGDGTGDNGDVDDDNDGLIEINSAELLNQVRYNLAGTSLRTSAGGIGSSLGCGNGNDTTACSGYELTANITLSAYENWAPIGTCIADNNCPAAFSSAFEGNNAIISGLTINAEANARGIGLFGAIGSNAILRNIRIRDASIQGGANDVGILAGYAHNARMTSISVVRGEIISPAANNVGGLVGREFNSAIAFSYVLGANVNGSDNTGSFIGNSDDVVIIFSYAAESRIIGGDNTGGFIGNADNALIVFSFVSESSTIGGDNTGGFVGSADNAVITSSSVSDGSTTGGNNTGGLVGNADNTNIASAYALNITTIGNEKVGGLIGSGDSANITYTYVERAIVNGDEEIGGLVGSGANAMITSSYVADITASGLDKIGGFLGSGSDVIINSSYVAGATISGEDDIGGLVGYGEQMTVYSSYAAGGSVNGTNNVGGLLGSGLLSRVNISYAAVGSVIGNSNVSGLIGRTTADDGSMPAVVYFSYWDINTTGIGDRPGVSNAQEGEAKTTIELRNQTNFAGIYAAWGVDGCLDANQVKVKSWHLGNNQQRPVLTCVPPRN